MTTVWSGWRGGLRVGIDISLSPASVSPSTSSVAVTWTVYAQNMDLYSTGSYSWTTSGAKSTSGSGTGPYPADGRTWQVTQFTTSVATSYTRSVSSTLTASLNWPYNGAAPSVSRTVTISQRPPNAPTAPSAVHAAVSGSSILVSWTRPSNASDPGYIWSNVIVQRQVDVYSTTGWTTVATLSGSATSWFDTNVTGNHQYFYKVYARNSTGQSGAPDNVEGWVQTKPAAPTSVVAKRSGSNIVVSWQDNSPFDNGWKIEDSPDGTTWTTLTAIWSYTSTSYTQVSPSTSVTHRYRVTAHTSNGLSATSATSNIVTLISPPAVPSSLSPSVVATGDSTAWTWTYNSTDTSPQTGYEISYSTDNGATWSDTGEIASPTSAWTPTAVVATAGIVRWQVRTWGADASPSPWSPVKQTVVSTAPVVAITNPGPAVDLSSVQVTWTYSQAEASPQAQWSTQIATTDGTIVASSSGSGTTTTWASGTVLADGASYTLIVSVQSAVGIWSSANQSFTVTYDAPVPPTIALDDQTSDGYIGVTLTTTINGTDPNAVSLRLERSINNGPWLLLWEDDVTHVTWDDYGCSLTGKNSYRATAISALPSQSSSITDYTSTMFDNQDAAIVSNGDGLSSVMRFSFVQAADFTGGASQVVLNEFAGREFAVPTYGQGKATVIQVTAQLLDPTNTDELEAQRSSIEDINSVFYAKGVKMYRDTLGRRFYCTLSQPQVGSGYAPPVTFTASQADVGTVVEGVVE